MDLKSLRRWAVRAVKRPDKATRQGYYKDRYGPHRDKLSVDYRENEKAILAGQVPDKYERVRGVVPGDRVLEIGAGEGILSLYLSLRKEQVTALDITPSRLAQARVVQSAWQELGLDVGRCNFVVGDLFENLDLLDNVDTVVASRVIYYFRHKIDLLFKEIARRGVRAVVLIGNEVRNREWEASRSGGELGSYAHYSTVEGMQDVLLRHGYSVLHVIREGDPVVVGQRTLGG